MKKRAIAMVLVLLVLLTACNPLSKTELVEEETIVKRSELDKDQYFSFSGLTEINGFNPLIYNTAEDRSVNEIVYEALVRNVTNERGLDEVKPGVAEDWDISQDGLRYIFYLREDAVWSDGVPVTSDDFVYTFRLMATPKIKASNAWLFEDLIVNFAAALYNEGLNEDYDKKPEEIGVRAINDKTLEIHLEKPNTSFLELIDKVRPVRQDKYEEWQEDYGRTLDKTLFNGQFVVDKWEKDQLVFKKNENYWNEDRVKLDKLKRLTYSSEEEAVEAFIDGEIDCLNVMDLEDKSKIESSIKDVKVVNNPGISPEIIGFNCNNKYLKNDKIRLALSLGFNREDYINKFKSKNDEALYSLIPSALKMGERTYADRVNYKNNIIKELEESKEPKKLLEEGLREENLKLKKEDLVLTYSYRKDGDSSQEEAEWFKESWEKNLGIKIKLEEKNLDQMINLVEENKYDIYRMGWEPDFSDPASVFELYNPKYGYFNRKKTGWTGPGADKYEKTLAEASMAGDVNNRSRILLEAEKIILHEAVVAPLYVASNNLYIKQFVKGFNKTPHTSVDFTNIYTFGR